jgi:hypothetical protein
LKGLESLHKQSKQRALESQGIHKGTLCEEKWQWHVMANKLTQSDKAANIQACAIAKNDSTPFGNVDDRYSVSSCKDIASPDHAQSKFQPSLNDFSWVQKHSKESQSIANPSHDHLTPAVHHQRLVLIKTSLDETCARQNERRRNLAKQASTKLGKMSLHETRQNEPRRNLAKRASTKLGKMSLHKTRQKPPRNSTKQALTKLGKTSLDDTRQNEP